MSRHVARWGAIGVLLAFCACGGGEHIHPGNGDGGDGGGHGDGALDAAAALTIAPQDAVVTVVAGQPLPTLQYTATRDGQSVQAAWSIDRGELGTISGSGGLFTPAGTRGGKANIIADYQGVRATTSVTVKLQRTDVGDPAYPAPAPGAGGYGGVGGNGPGSPPTTDQQNTLNGTPVADATVKLLYPYDQTVWPRGILAPLLQWSAGAHSFDSAYVHLVEDSYEYKGYFGKPSAAPFVNLPIPQAAWEELAYSNAGEAVTMTLILGEGSTAYGPYTLTWKIAHATLKGTVYYNSYGTALVKNGGFGTYPGGTGPAIGGATLAIKPGATDPALVAGTNSADHSGCRVCHAVAASGSMLTTQHGPDYTAASRYDLLNGNTESVLPCLGVAYPALYPDGSLLFSGSGGMRWGDTQSQLYDMPGCALAGGVSGLPAGLKVTLPAFSPDGKHVAFNFWAGATGADTKSLGAMEFDLAAKTFSNLRVIHTPAGGLPVAWSSFLPTNDAVVFEIETASTTEYGFTRDGIRGELWWVDLATKTATRLDKLNGLGFVPTGPNNHDDDTTVNYEPTVSPIASGGYAWVVFTSRRLYGNVATIDPWLSDPRNYDMTAAVTTKKLWVAAIDLGAAPGTDPSHPAFYVPAQEILAGNSRGFWSLDACHPDGVDCQTGDECCGGYCQPTDGGLECTSTPPTCAGEYERCTTDTDCCGYGQGISCINGFCTSIIQ
jgi:hypothetical protein